jgi:hypothetical protein
VEDFRKERMELNTKHSFWGLSWPIRDNWGGCQPVQYGTYKLSYKARLRKGKWENVTLIDLSTRPNAGRAWRIHKWIRKHPFWHNVFL